MRSRSTTFVLLLLSISSSPLVAQDGRQLQLPQLGGSSDFQVGGGFGDDPVQLTGAYVVEQSGTRGRLSIKTEISDHWHIYSLTQKDGGPDKSILKVATSPNFQLTSDFKANRDPQIEPADLFPVESEVFDGEVIFTAPFKIADGVDPTSLKFMVTYQGQACEDQADGLGKCLPLGPIAIDVVYAGTYEAPKGGAYRDESVHVELEATVSPAVIEPGGHLQLQVTATPEASYHVYAISDEKGEVAADTLIALTKANGWKFDRATTSSTPIEDEMLAGLFYHEEPVTWSITIDVPQDAETGTYDLAGVIGYQSCTHSSCDRPAGARFTATITVGATQSDGVVPVQFTAASYRDAEVANEQMTKLIASRPREIEPIKLSSLLPVVGFSLLGGLLLNLMPCVLPVIGLKVMSFVEQAGENRSRVIALNLWYSAGLIAVFLVLATLAAFLNFGWGEQFTVTWFKVLMTALVFAMALSFLGTWEIPIPGFAGSGKASELQQKEGLSGAFFKGMFTTILATPCSGPFLGPVFGYTLTQPIIVTYIVFTCVGLGMASPYLVIGLVPGLVKHLPKPGAWMEVFKQVMGFVLLGTVVYLFSTISPDFFLATLALLIGIWFACWWVGRTPITASPNTKATSWIGGAIVATVVGYCGFTYLTPHQELLPWEPYSQAALDKANAEGKTVLVDFTADWCPTCKMNLRFAIDRPKVLEVVEENEVVTLIADWTDKSVTIKRKLHELNSNSIPLLAIYPHDKDEPIVLRDRVSQTQVIEALTTAGPSKSAEVETAGVDLLPASSVGYPQR